MRRFKNNLPDLVPFINSDFNDILQNQHQLAYSAWLESINDVGFTESSSNSGIILKGCELTSVKPKVDTTTGNITFDYKLKFKPSDLIYIDGQYYSPDNSLLTNSIFNVTDVNQFYLVGVTASDTTTELAQNRIRTFRDGQQKSFSVDYRFQLVNSNFPQASQGLKYVGFEWGGTSRRLKRLLKHAKSNKGDVQITTTIPDKNAWDLTPLIGTNSQLLTQPPLDRYLPYESYLFRDFDTSGVGRNEMKGFRMYSELSEKFMVGLSSSSPVSPVVANPLQINYGKIGNIGGSNSVTLTPQQIPNHDHGGKVIKSNPADLNHGHKIASYLHTSHLPSDRFTSNIDGYNWAWTNSWGVIVNTGKKYDVNTEVPNANYGYFLERKITPNQQINFPDYGGGGDFVWTDGKWDPHGFGSAQYWADGQKWYKIYNGTDYNYLFGAIGTSGGKGRLIPEQNATNISSFRSNWQDLRSVPPPKAPNEPTGLKITSTSNWRDYLYWDKTLLGHTHQLDNTGGGYAHENRPPYYVVIYYVKI